MARTKEHGFIPHAVCNVMSGDCFHESRCLGNCRKLAKEDHETRIKTLERRVVDLEIRIIQLERKP